MQKLIIATTKGEYEAAAGLFIEYAKWLGIDLGFQHFDEEIQELETMYAAPQGGIILCKQGHDYIGCVAIRKLTDDIAELKRMYVQPQYQKMGIGKKILERSLQLAKEINYSIIHLDTLSNMLPAINLYKQYGFNEIAPYYYNPNATAVYFEKRL